MINPRRTANLFDSFHVSLHSFEVRLSQRPRFSVQLRIDFQAAEQSIVLERKLKFIMVHDVEHNYFVAAKAKLLQRFAKFLRIKKQIRKQNHHSTRTQLRRQRHERVAHIGRVFRFGFLKFVKNGFDVRRMRTVSQRLVDLVAEQNHAHGISLLLHQNRQARRCRRRVIELAATGLFAVSHRFAAVHQQVTLEVGLFFVLFNIEAIRFRPDFPVDMPEVITRSVLAMGRKLDRKTVERRAMLARHKTFHDQTRLHVKPLDLVQRCWIEVISLSRFGHTEKRCSGSVQKFGSDSCQAPNALANSGAT